VGGGERQGRGVVGGGEGQGRGVVGGEGQGRGVVGGEGQGRGVVGGEGQGARGGPCRRQGKVLTSLGRPCLASNGPRRPFRRSVASSGPPGSIPRLRRVRPVSWRPRRRTRRVRRLQPATWAPRRVRRPRDLFVAVAGLGGLFVACRGGVRRRRRCTRPHAPAGAPSTPEVGVWGCPTAVHGGKR
jgi:hypothetical protein